MKMIDVLNLMAEGKIEKNTKLIVSDGFGEYEYKYRKGYRAFYNNFDKISKMRIDDEFRLDDNFLNMEVELIPPKPKKYLIKLNIKWLSSPLSYVIYYNDGPDQHVIIGNKVDNFGSKELGFYRAYFTEQELQSIQPVREFLEDMQGKFELIEVEDNAID